MAKVLLAWELGGGAGHCTKLSVLANGLIEHGHNVWIAARELPTAQHVFSSKRVHFFQAPLSIARPPNPMLQTRSLTHILHNNGFGDTATLLAYCAGWRSIFEAIMPDMLICDHAPVALLASHWHSMRRVTIGTGFSVPPIVTPFPDLSYWDSAATKEQLQRDEEVILARVNKMLANDSLQEFGALADLYAEVDESFVLSFRELDHYPNRESTQYWGSLSRLGGAPPEWPAGRHRVFAYLKPPAPNWPLGEFLTTLNETGLPAIVYIAGGESPDLSKCQSARLRIASSYMNIAEVAKHCDLAILNGTSGTAAAFLLAGVPQLNMPLFLEQLVQSRRIADLGAGVVANPARPREAFAQAFEVLGHDRFRSAAQACSRRYLEYDSAQIANEIVSRLHKLLGT